MTSNKTDALASYRERIPFIIDRTIELHADSIRVVGKVRASRIDATVRIANLGLPPDRVWIRSLHLRWSSMTVSVLGLLLIGASQVWPKTPSAVGSLFLVFLAAVYYFFRSRNEIEYAQFKSREGSAVLFDVGRVGPDSQRFDDFVTAIEEQIARHSDKRADPVSGSASI